MMVPAYNEAGTIAVVLERVLALPGVQLEVIVVDDGSTDRTGDVARVLARRDARVRVLTHPRNRGKGAAIRTALAHASADVAVVQDADLENDPRDPLRLLERLTEDRAPVVYGSRWLSPQSARPFSSWVAAKALSWLTRLHYGARVTDVPTCYKMFRTRLLRSLALESEGFDFCPEVTAKALLAGHEILEVPISYRPRGRKEGKKVRWRHGLEAVWTLVKVKIAGGATARALRAVPEGRPIPC
ncbi:MAG: glycosyltransferase family 2 protein [Planctomycetes bacterium]|nr:glycosyltransferase family 2 protein [Planctomycetota bacterium]